MEKVGRRAFKKPDVEELRELNKEKTRKELAEHYHVSIGLIAKWLKEFGLVKNNYTTR